LFAIRQGILEMRTLVLALLAVAGSAFGSGSVQAQPATSAPPPPTAAAAAAAAAVTPEVSDVATLPPAGPHRLWLEDPFGGSVQVIDGDTGSVLATIAGASLSSYAADASQRTVYVAESIWSKGNRGVRQDMVTVYDGASLKPQAEIPLPSRAYVANTPALFALSPGGARAYVYNMQPASSMVVVDLAGRRVLRTVDTPGCALAFVWGDDGFSSLCGDGSLATVTTGGAKPTLTRSAPFFDAERDPVFEQSPSDSATGQSLFVTYSGMIHPVRLGMTPRFAAPWSLQEAGGLAAASLADGSLAWRPGGHTPMALHRSTGKLYVLMHPGEPWSQQKAGTELWVVDTQLRKVVRRMELQSPAEAVAISQDAQPLLYLIDEKHGLSIRDAGTLNELRSVEDVGRVIPYAPGT
jgi:methylamine dehydrogenase heavy chain